MEVDYSLHLIKSVFLVDSSEVFSYPSLQFEIVVRPCKHNLEVKIVLKAILLERGGVQEAKRNKDVLRRSAFNVDVR